MDVWKHERVIYAYLIWIVVKATAAGRVFDVTTLPLQTVIAEAGGNITLACPGVTEHSLVLMLEWRVNGIRILEYSSSSTTVWDHRNRVSLSPSNFALIFHPVTAADSGEYQCLVNSRNKPEAIVKLIVQERFKIIDDSNELSPHITCLAGKSHPTCHCTLMRT